MTVYRVSMSRNHGPDRVSRKCRDGSTNRRADIFLAAFERIHYFDFSIPRAKLLESIQNCASGKVDMPTFHIRIR